MEGNQWSRIEYLFHEAAELSPAERPAFLDHIGGQDEAIRHEVESLLAADIPAESLIGLAVDRCVQHLSTDPNEGCDLLGQRIGPYSIAGFIGKGGMGTVYRAVREDPFRMEVAIKLLTRGTDTEAALGRFRVERQILAGLQHVNIARLLDGGATEAGLPYFAMEYVDGTPLLVYAAPLSIRQRLELFQAVCSAVQYAHHKHIVHRDIKPSNILVTRDGIPKLLDFGIAKLLDPSAAANTTGITGGARAMTPSYASPEQLRGERVTTATDVYSLGAVLYELLTGQPAYDVNEFSPEAFRSAVCTKEPRKPSAVVKHLDRDLDSIVLMALRKQPERRYASVEQFSRDIDRYLHHWPVDARQDSLSYRGRKFAGRNRALIATAGLTAVMVVALIAGLSRYALPNGATDSSLRSVAVLPLADLSGDEQQEYFAEGVTDELINKLAQIQGLRVISRTSSMSFRGVRRSLPEIARSLGVQMIAEGSVLRSGSRVRLAVRLIDAPNDRAVWSRAYEGEIHDLLTLQEQVATAIAGEIGVALTAGNLSRLSRHQRVDLGAYDAYLKGRHQYATAFTQESMQKAIAWFEQALALDPGYAPAYAGLADCYYILSNQYYAPREVMPKARWAALKAIELDPTLGEAHATLALVRSLYDFKRAEAEQGFRRAIELKPSDAQAHLWYGLHLTGMGRFDEAITEIERARKLDPISPTLNGYVGPVLYFAHRYDQVIERMQPIIETYPKYHQPHAWLALAYEQKGDWPKAIAEMKTSFELYGEEGGGGADGLAQIGHIYAMSGRRADARRMLTRVKELSRLRYVSAWDFALLYAGLGEWDEALRWIEKVEADRSEMFALIQVDPRFDALHGDPRFASILHGVGLER